MVDYFVLASTWKPCDPGLMQKPQPEANGPTGLVRLSVAEANTMMRVRRSLGRLGGGSATLLMSTTNDDNGDVDRRPYWRATRNFMRFGRNPSTGNDDVLCLPAVAADEEPEVTSAEVDETPTSKGSDEKRFSRSGRDQYDYNGKPFMRFGKRAARRNSPEFMGSRQGDVVCFRAIVDGRETGKRFMRFGRTFAFDTRGKGEKEEQATDLGEEEKRVVRFGKPSSYAGAMESGADYEKQDDQAKI